MITLWQFHFITSLYAIQGTEKTPAPDDSSDEEDPVPGPSTSSSSTSSKRPPSKSKSKEKKKDNSYSTPMEDAVLRMVKSDEDLAKKVYLFKYIHIPGKR